MMTQTELNELYEEFRIQPEDDRDTKLDKTIRYYLAVTDRGGKAINYKLPAKDTAGDFIFYMKRCGITVLDDPAFANLTKEFCVILFYPKQ